MGNFSIKTRGRCWVGTINVANMQNAGLNKEEYENPEFLAKFFIDKWEQSGKGRKAGIAVCVSAQGLYHAHIACYGNTTTLKAVAEILYGSHIEPQLGKKEELKNYLLKNGEYEEKGETVLHTVGLDVIEDNQGARNDIEEIESMINEGYTPNEIFDLSITYRKYTKLIKEAFLRKRTKDMPIIKEMFNEWHVGNSGTGKTYTYIQLCEEYGEDNVYMLTDFENGGFDLYLEQGAPPILFIDEFKGGLKFGQLLNILDKYSKVQTHCRYANTCNLWEKVYITSIFPPEELYESLVNDDKRKRDNIQQLLRRLNTIVYHYVEDGKYKTYSMPANEYLSYRDLIRRATADKDDFIKVTDNEEIPFKQLEIEYKQNA